MRRAVAYNRRVRVLVLLVALVAACRPDPVPLNPYKNKQRGGPPEVMKTPAQAPSAMVTKRDGSQVDLATFWEKQKVVLIFYRGGWCPHCQKQLSDLQANQGELARAGAIVMGISSDSVDDANKTRDKLGLNYELYSDPELKVISQWGVEDVSTNIALSAVFIIEPGGAISYRRIGKNPADHPPIEELVAALHEN